MRAPQNPGDSPMLQGERLREVRSASPSGHYNMLRGDSFMAYGATSSNRESAVPLDSSRKRSRSQPILVSRFVYTRRLKQRTVREVSSKLVQEAKKSYFHGRFTSSHGAVITLPSRAQQLATYLPSERPGSPGAAEMGSPRTRKAPARPPALNDSCASNSLQEGMSASTSATQFHDPIYILQRSHSADDFHPFRDEGFLQSLSSDPRTVSAAARHASPLPPSAMKRYTSPTSALVELRFDNSLKLNSSVSLRGDASPAPTALSEGTGKDAKHVTIGESTECAAVDDDEEEYMISMGGALINLIFLAAPAALTIGFTFCTSIIPLAFVGKLRGERELTGASVGYFVISSLILYPMIGLTFAMDTLCSHEFGRDSTSAELGLILQRGILINFIVLTPLCCGIYLGRGVLEGFYGKDVAGVAMDFLHFSPLLIYPLAVLIAFTKFLNNQLQPHIPMIALTAGVFVTPMVQYAMTPLGVRYTMLGMAATTLFQLFVMVAMTFITPETRHRLGPWRLRDALAWTDVKHYILLALPSALFVAAEASTFDISVLLSATYGEAQGSVWSAIMNILFLFAALSGGISTSACANIGRCIGANDPFSAKRYVKLAITFALMVGVVDSIIMVLFFDNLLSLFGVSAATKQLALPIRYLLPALHVADSVQFTFQGIFSGLGQNHLGALILLLSLWGIGLPLSFFFGSFWHYGILGVCLGLTIGLCIEAPIMVGVATCYLDYNELCYLHFLSVEADDEESEESEESEEDSYDEEYVNDILRRSGIVLPQPRVEADPNELHRQLWKQLAPRNYKKKYVE